MRPNPLCLSISLVLLFAFLTPPLAGAATKRSSKSSASKSSAAKKKPTPTPAKKKTPVSEDATSAGGGKSPTTGSPLDLPLPQNDKGSAERGDARVKSAPAESKPPATPVPAGGAKQERAPNATVEPEAIAEFAAQPPRVQQLIRDALDLTRLNLIYTFGSADPDQGGMDCSGTIYYLLRAHGFSDIARDSTGQYLWARKSGGFFPVVSRSEESVEFAQLMPGDLLFWTGTYTNSRDVPISHVMLYLGREKKTGKRIMFGASDGRSYNGIQRWGVSVFDFKMPKADPANPEKSKVDFVGFARIPGLRTGAAAPTVQEEAKPAEPPKETVKSSATPKPRSKSTTKKSKSRK